MKLAMSIDTRATEIRTEIFSSTEAGPTTSMSVRAVYYKKRGPKEPVFVQEMTVGQWDALIAHVLAQKKIKKDMQRLRPSSDKSSKKKSKKKK